MPSGPRLERREICLLVLPRSTLRPEGTARAIAQRSELRKLAARSNDSLPACSILGPGQRSPLGHEDAFPEPALSARFRFSQATFDRTHGNGRDASFPDVRSEMRFDSNPSLLPRDIFLVGSKGTQTNYNGK